MAPTTPAAGAAAAAPAAGALLDQLLPTPARGRADSAWLPVAPGSVFAVLQRIEPDELPPLRRALRLAGPLAPLARGKPLYAQLLDAGFAVLGVVPLREVAVGRVARPTRVLAPTPRVKDRREFAAWDEPAHVKVALSFQLAGEERGAVRGTRVTAAVRVAATDAAGERLLALAWPLVGVIAGSVSRAWLAAVARRLADTTRPAGFGSR